MISNGLKKMQLRFQNLQDSENPCMCVSLPPWSVFNVLLWCPQDEIHNYLKKYMEKQSQNLNWLKRSKEVK